MKVEQPSQLSTRADLEKEIEWLTIAARQPFLGKQAIADAKTKIEICRYHLERM